MCGQRPVLREMCVLCGQTTMTNMLAIDTNMFPCSVDTYSIGRHMFVSSTNIYWSNVGKYICFKHNMPTNIFVLFNKHICFHQQIYLSKSGRQAFRAVVANVDKYVCFKHNMPTKIFVYVNKYICFQQQIYSSNSGRQGLELLVLMWANVCA